MFHWLVLTVFLVGVFGQADKDPTSTPPPCFEFHGDSFLEFRPDQLSMSDRVHYSLEFNATASTGVLLYAEGPHDYEALFLRDGRLIYLLTNPSASGVEGTSGALQITDVTITTGQWYTVDLWRNWQLDDRVQTGFALHDNSGQRLEYRMDDMNHRGVNLRSPIYIGGIGPNSVHVRTPLYFSGQLRLVREQHNDLDFRTYHHNYQAKVKVCS